QGIISAEELVEIHQLGDEMDRLKPRAAVIAHRAVVEVEKLERERAALKARKKREAAERKRIRAEEVARRRATDIIYLGRGVSKGLADRKAKVEKLQSLDLPVLTTPTDVATALGLTVPRLRWLVFHSEASKVSHYVRFTIPKRSGGQRALAAPHEYLAKGQ